MDQKESAKWLEVSIEVDGEMAEVVAEVIARYVPNGVVIESLNIAAEPDGEGYPVGDMRVYGYLPIDQKVDNKRQKLEEAFWYLSRIRDLPAADYRIIESTNWAESWKEHYHPVKVGKRLVIVPAWLESKDRTRLAIRIDPGMAFGTGTHPTTHLCLEILDELMPDGTGAFLPMNGIDFKRESSRVSHMIDIGCGSGILSIAAHLLGVGQVLGVDIDQQAVEIAKTNAFENDIDEGVEFHAGTLTNILDGKYSFNRAPIIIANIMTHILIKLLDDGLAGLLASGGILVLSGILNEQETQMTAAIDRHSLEIISRRHRGDWVALILVQGNA